MDDFKLYNFNKIGSSDVGYLTALEGNSQIPFPIKRVYYIFDVPSNIHRGFHAHRNLKQMLICVCGSVEVKVVSKNNRTSTFKLDTPTSGLFINSMVWREMYNFDENTVLLVLASELYDEKDYIRGYDEFLKLV